ncbi:MAG: molybdenum cofactor biosynthesis protein MoaE [Bacillota bacterium]
MNDWIAILDQPIPVAGVLEFVTDPAAGGISIFLGTTRAEQNASGQELLALDYEAYTQMALEQLENLARQAREEWPIAKLAVLHRTGRVPLGQASVLIAVSAPHRSDSFAACRFLIDTLKRDVAIWKKEIWADGTATWK